MQNKANLYNEERFEELEMEDLLGIQGGELDNIFDSIRNVFRNLLGKDDLEFK